MAVIKTSFRGYPAQALLSHALLSGIVAVAGLQTAARATTLRVLEAAIDQWYEQLDCYGAYDYFFATAQSAEDALAGSFTPGSKVREYYGVIAKSGRRVRQSHLFAGKKTGKIVSGQAVPASMDAVGAGDVEITLIPQHASIQPQASFIERQRDDKNWHQLRHSGGVRSPLNIMGNADPHPLHAFDKLEGEVRETTIRDLDSSHVQVVMRKSYSDGEATLSVTFWTKPELPVVEAVNMSYAQRNGPALVALNQCSDFIDCHGVLVPRTIRFATNATYQESKTWLAYEWHSHDLGAREPTDEDFVLTLRPKTSVNGLKRLPRSDREAKIDVSKLTLADLVRDAELPPPADSQWRQIAGLFAGLLLLVGGYAWWRWRAASAM